MAASTVLAAGLTLSGCASGDSPLAEADPDAVPQSTTFDQVSAIIERECRPCHDEGGQDPPFDTCEHILENYRDLIEQVIQKNRMPPGAWPRLSSEEKLTLTRWNGVAPCRP